MNPEWEHLKPRANFASHALVLEMCVGLSLRVPGHIVEFGVASGHSTRAIRDALVRAQDAWPAAPHADKSIFACDSFEGLPSPFEALRAGHFACEPPTIDGVEIVKGYFSQTLTQELERRIGAIAFAHFDADLHSSTACALSFVTSMLVTGSLLLFDEFTAADGAERRAFEEWRQARGIETELVAEFARPPSGGGKRTDRRVAYQVVGPAELWPVHPPRGHFAPGAFDLDHLVAPDIVADTSNLRLGANWFPLEVHAGEAFRWVENDAELLIEKPQTIRLEVEAGPGLGAASFALELRRQDGSRPRIVQVEGRANVDIELDAASYHLHVEGGGRSCPGDSRILNFRVLGIRSLHDRGESRAVVRPFHATMNRMNSETPAVSVVIATYNWSNVLRCAIESVLWQTFSDFELLVIGDGCTDNTAEVVGSFADARVHWHNLPGNSGHQSAPNNYGIGIARGAYIAYLGHDDVWHPSHLSHLHQKIGETNADFVHSLGVMLGPPESNARIPTGLWPDSTYRRGFSVPPSTMMHTTAIARQIGGWRDYRTIATQPDIDLLERIYDAGARFARCERLTVFKFNSSWRKDCYRERPSHEQEDYIRRIREETDFLEHEWLAIARIPTLGLPVAPATIRHRDDPPDGWLVGQYRRQRGLETGEVELDPPDAAEVRRLRGENEILRRACNERLIALEALNAECARLRAEVEILRTASDERLAALLQLDAAYVALRGESDVLRQACADRLALIERLDAECAALRANPAQR